jgi:hypothetical protein
MRIGCWCRTGNFSQLNERPASRGSEVIGVALLVATGLGHGAVPWANTAKSPCKLDVGFVPHEAGTGQ